MSRSFKKSPVVSPSSSKEFNSKANRRERHLVRMLLLTVQEHGQDADSIVLPVKREISNIYDSPKDGRCNMFGMKMDGDDGAELKKLLRK